MRAFREVELKDLKNSFAVQFHDLESKDKKLDAAVKYWKDQDVQILNIDASEFMDDLFMTVKNFSAKK